MHIVIVTEQDEIVDMPAIQEIARLGVDVGTCRAAQESYDDALREVLRADTFGILVDGPFVESDLYADCSALRLIISTDFDHAKSWKLRGITKANVNAAYDDSRAELALGLAISHLRRIASNDASVRRGGWTVAPGNQLSSLSVGVFSSSSVGHHIAKLFSAFSKATKHYSSKSRPSVEISGKHDVICVIDDVGDEALANVALSSLRVGGLLLDISRFPAFSTKRLKELVGSARLSGAATIDYAVNQRSEKSSQDIFFVPCEVLRTIEASEKARRLASDAMLDAVRTAI